MYSRCMNVARMSRAPFGLALVVAALGCKKPVATTDEVTAVSTVPIPSSAPPTLATGLVNPGMADLTPQPVTGANPGGGNGSNPFASAVPSLPAKLPRDPGGASPLKIVPMKIIFAAGRTADSATELRSDGSLLFDGQVAGKMSRNKITLKKAPITVALRSDGFVTVAIPKGAFFKRDASGITSRTGFRLRVGPDNASIVADVPGSGPVTYGQVSIPLLDDATKTTALMVATTEASRVPAAAAPVTVAQGNPPVPSGAFTINLDFSKATITPGKPSDVPPPDEFPQGN